jgi:uncharacterized membrane protein (UPF0127 family)
LLAIAGLGACSTQALGERAPTLFADLTRTTVQVVTATGRHRFHVWIADAEPSRARGLMFVRELPADQGMLFLFERPQFAAFWMKNTYLALDLVFIAADGLVVNVARDAEPFSESPIESVAPVKGVLELGAGTAERIGLAPGDHVVHRAFSVENAHR